MTPPPGKPAAGAAVWWAGARPRTLGVGVIPVAVGAAASGHPTPVRTAGTLAVALGLQVGANYANDYFDGVRGVDTAQRVGPARLVAGGAASPRAVLGAAGVSLGLAAVVGLWLALATGQGQLIMIGGLAVLAALLYTGGPRPYAGIGIADVAVFLFFGLFATCGTVMVEVGHTTRAGWWAAVPVGLLAVAVLMANNLRDLETDRAAGRRTLMVRLGRARSVRLYQGITAAAPVSTIAGVALGGLPVEALLALASVPLAIQPTRLAGQGEGVALAPILAATARLHLIFGALLLAGLTAAAVWG